MRRWLIALTALSAVQVPAFANSRETHRFGLNADVGQCYGYYAAALLAAHLGSRWRFGLGFEHVFERSKSFRPTRFRPINTAVAQLKWMMTDADFSGFLGLVSTGLLQIGADYVSPGGFNVGAGLATGTCTGFFVHFGIFF